MKEYKGLNICIPSVFTQTSLSLNMTTLHNISDLENLPNELLLMIFRYLTTFDIYHSFYTLNSLFKSLIQNEELDFYLTGKMSWEHAMFAIKKILPNLSKDKLRMIEINHNTVFWSLINANLSYLYKSLHTVHLKNLIKIPFASVMLLLNQSSQLKHLRIQTKSNRETAWLDGTKWDTLIEHNCSNIKTLYASISNLPSIQYNSNPKINSVTKTFQSPRWKQGQYQIYYFLEKNTGSLLITQSLITS